MTTYTHKATVEGVWEFPVDMLRYDQCFPETESDSAVIHDKDEKQPRRVRVVCYTDHKYPRWTPARWESFGWRMVEDQP